jgi:hypothetical protein
MESLEVECEQPELRQRIQRMVRRAHAACCPINTVNSKPPQSREEREDGKNIAKAGQEANSHTANATTDNGSSQSTASSS